MRLLTITTGMVLLAATLAAAQALPVFNTGRLYTTEADFSRAIQPYQQAITANARNARAHYWLGFAHLYAYRQYLLGGAPYASAFRAKAIASLTEAIKLEPTMTDAYMAVHDAYSLGGEDEKANAVLKQMLDNTRPKWLAPVPAPQPGGSGR